MIAKTLITADELLMMPRDGRRRELVRGELIDMSPTNYDHGMIAIRLASLLDSFARPRQLGHVLGTDSGFLLEKDPDTVRAPDVAFVRADRVPSPEERRRFPALAPDLVAEVVSPSDRSAEIESKVHDYLNAGVRLIWVLYPSTRTVTEYRSRDQIRVLTETDHLDGQDVIPGFSVRVAELFE